jgi:hypothetical protein
MPASSMPITSINKSAVRTRFQSRHPRVRSERLQRGLRRADTGIDTSRPAANAAEHSDFSFIAAVASIASGLQSCSARSADRVVLH